MTQKNIDSGNKLIAIFMGSKYVNSPYKANKEDTKLTNFWAWTKPTNGFPRCAVTNIEWSTAVQVGNFKYHCSWDWLNPVIDQINIICKPKCLEHYYWNYHTDIRTVRDTMENTFNEVVKFIKWHNELIKSKQSKDFMQFYNTFNKSK